MGRKSIEIDIPLLKKTIEEVEQNGPLVNQSALFKEVATRMGNRFAPQIVGLRIKTHNIEIKTKPGRKGWVGGQPRSNKNGKKREKFNSEYLEKLRKNTPKKHHKLIEGMARGSIKCAIALNCLGCAGWDREEVRHCDTADTCAWYSLRPFKLPTEKLNNEQSNEYSSNQSPH